MQAIDPLDNGAALELTVARYTTPAGADISGVGVPPQIHAVATRGRQHDEALARGAPRARPAGQLRPGTSRPNRPRVVTSCACSLLALIMAICLSVIG